MYPKIFINKIIHNKRTSHRFTLYNLYIYLYRLIMTEIGGNKSYFFQNFLRKDRFVPLFSLVAPSNNSPLSFIKARVYVYPILKAESAREVQIRGTVASSRINDG